MKTELESTATAGCPNCGAPLVRHRIDGYCSRCLAHTTLLEDSPGDKDEAALAGLLPGVVNGRPGRLQIDDFELIEEVARGGMGVVFKARQISLNREVALKMLLFARWVGAPARQRFHSEAATASALDHPNIVRVLQAGEHEGQPFLVMPFIAGPSLAELLRSGPMPARMAAECLATVARAVHFAHERGVLHRDLKPSNILLDGESVPHVTDFGLAKNLRADTELTRTGQTIGSPNYMPPEQCRAGTRKVASANVEQRSWPPRIAPDGDPGRSIATFPRLDRETHNVARSGRAGGQLDLESAKPFTPSAEDSGASCLADATDRAYLQAGPPSDNYSLGAVLFHCLTARPPFVGDDIAAVLQQVLNEEPLAPSQLNPSVPRDLETICLKCLEKEPTRRYQTAQELAEELDRFLKDEPILARPVSRAERVWRWCRRKPALAACIFLLLLLLLVLGIGGPLAALRIDQARRTAEDRELQARRVQYAADMRLAHQAQMDGDLPTVRRLLERHVPGTQKSGEKSQETPDGRRIPILTPDSRLLSPDLRGWEWRHLWRESQGSPRAVLGRHNTNACWMVGLLPGGQSAFSAGRDGTVKLYDLPSRKVVGELQHDDPVTAAAVSPDGRWLVTTTHKLNHGRGKKPVVVWDLPAREEAAVLFANIWPREGTLAISPDSKVFAFVDQDDPENLRVCALPTGLEIARFPAQTDLMHPQGIAFTPSGRTMVFSADVEGTLVLVDTSQWREVGRLKGHRRNVNSLAVSPDSRWLASVSLDRSLRLWALEDRREVAARQTLTSESYSVAFSPDGTRLAATIGPSVSIYSVPNLERIVGLSTPSGGTECVAFASDQELLAGSGDGSVTLFNLNTEKDSRDVARFTQGLTEFFVNSASTGPAISMSPDKTALLGVFTNNTFSVWQLPGLKSTGEVPLPVTNFSCAAISSRGETAAFADRGGNVVLWRAADGQVAAFGRVGKAGHSRMAFSSDGRRLAFGGFGWHFVWDVTSREQTHSFPSTNGQACMVLAFSPDDQSLVAGEFTGATHYWPLNSSGRPRTLRGDQEQVKSLVFADHGKTLITPNNGVRFWNLSSGEQTRLLTGLPGYAARVAISQDETRLAVGNHQGDISILDLVTGEEVLRLKASGWDIRHLAFSADGNSLIGVDREEIHVWRADPFSETDSREPSNAIQP